MQVFFFFFFCLLVIHRTVFKIFFLIPAKKEWSFTFLADSQQRRCVAEREEGGEKAGGGSSHRSLTWTALLEKGSDVTDTSLLFVFATPISSVTGACGETRQSITVPSLLSPVLSSSSSPCVFITLRPLALLSFFSLLIHSFFNHFPPPPFIHSHLVWLLIVSS